MSESIPPQPANGDVLLRRRDGRTMDCGGDGAANHVRSRAEIEHARRALTRAQLRQDEALAVIARGDELATSRSAIEDAIAVRIELRANVAAFVRELHDEGVPPEQMLVQVKHAIREILPSELDANASRDLMSDVVRWSIDAYYADLPPGGAGP